MFIYCDDFDLNIFLEINSDTNLARAIGGDFETFDKAFDKVLGLNEMH